MEFKQDKIYKKRRFFLSLLTIIIIILSMSFIHLNNMVKEQYPVEAFAIETSYSESRANILPVYKTIIESEPIYTDEVEYINYDLPKDADGQFKTFMDYKTITDQTSTQWQMQQEAETNDDGLRILNDKYMVAMGTYYAEECGKEFRITLEGGEQIDVIIGDIKDNAHTDINNQYIPMNGNIIEFIVDTAKLDPITKQMGDISHSGFEGKIIKIEELKKEGLI